MQLAKSMTVLSACILLCSSQCLSYAFAQAPLPVEPDRPTQRWLPLPQGDTIELSEQARLLQQLRDLISSESAAGASDSPLPKLSEQQLREMERALESMRQQIGEDKLPNLESIPKEWIDQALSDPVLRKQAQQLLEQYTRDRKLPTPPDRTPRNSDGVPFPRRQPSDKSGDNPKSATRPTPNTSPKSKSPNEPFSSNPSSGPASNSLSSEAPASNKPDPNLSLPVGRPPSEGNAPVDKGSSDPFDGQPITPNGLRDRSPAADEFGQPAERSLPAQPDAERIEALQELFRKLKTIEGQRQPEKSVPNQNSGNSKTQNATQGNLNSGSNNRIVKPNAPSVQSNPATPRGSRVNPKPMQSSANESQKQVPPSLSPATPNGKPNNDPSVDPIFLPPESENSNSASSELDKSSPSKSSVPELQRKPSSRTGTQSSTPPQPPASGLRGSGSQAQSSGAQSSGAQSSGARSRSEGQIGNEAKSTERTRNSSPATPNENGQSAGGTASSLVPDLDIKAQLERHGLGRALQSIVEKTMKEQGESNPVNNPTTNKSANAQAKPAQSKPAQAKPSDNRAASKPMPAAAPAIPPASKSTASKPVPQISDAASRASGDRTTANSPFTSSPNPNSSSTMTGVRKMANQIWGAVQSTPGSSTSSSPTLTPKATGEFGNFGFAWSGSVWLLLGFALVVMVMLGLLARKRIVLAIAAKEAEAELAKEILTEGIRTRADVVRAFHRFVLRRAQPVANWWNHRYVASRLSETSPQLKSVISDLANVYEHARYLPPEVPLSSEEIDRVQVALKQCAACSV